MAMVVTKVIEEAHEGEIVSLAYNVQRKEIYSAADGDKAIKVWDSRSGAALRTQQGHKGMVTCLVFASSTRLLFSGSIDSTIGIWTEKGVNLQMAAVGSPVFSIAWDHRRRFLIAGGHSVVHLFKVDLAEARKLSQQQRSVASGLKDAGGPDAPQILRRVYIPLRGPELCHSDVVKCIVVTETGRLVTGGFDKAICIYEFDKLDKPKEAFSIKRRCHTAAIVSLAYDSANNCVLSGSIDGSMKVWSVEGRPLDHFDNISDQPVCVAYVPPTHMYWASGRFGRLIAVDPRAPSNVTHFVRVANGLDRFKICLLFTPPGCDLLLGGTHQRQLVIWQHDKAAAYRMFQKHEALVEALVVVEGGAAVRRAAREAQMARRAMEARRDPGGRKSSLGRTSPRDAASSPSLLFSLDVDDTPEADQAPEVFSAGADGKVLRWQLDADANCDIYECVEEIQLHSRNIHCITYAPELDSIITGGEDATIRVHQLSGPPRTFNDVLLPTSFAEHEGRVTGLALIKGGLLVSSSFDCSLRIWDLATMKALVCVPNAHRTPIQCLEYNPDRDELATCAMGNKVHVWDVKKPAAIKRKLVLNHAEHDGDDSDDERAGAGRGFKMKSSMNWLTRSDIQGLPKASNPLLDQVIAKASHDTPEVTQVRWAPWKRCWVTAADDDMIRLWGPDGSKLHAFTYNGGSVQALHVDAANHLLLATMLDKACYVYHLDDPIPKAVFTGHTDVIRAVGFVPCVRCYITASWDKSLRLWFCPVGAAGAWDASHHNKALQEGANKDASGLAGDEDEDEVYISSYEKAHPLEVPRALTDANQWQILKAIGVVEDEKGGKKGKHRNFKVDDGVPEEAPDVPGTLGSRLTDLGKELLQEINTIAKQRKAAMDALEVGTGGAAPGNDKAGKGGRGGRRS